MRMGRLSGRKRREAASPGLPPMLKVKLLDEIWHKPSLNGDVVIVSATAAPTKAPPGLHQIAGIQTQEVKEMAVRKMCK